MCGIFYNIRRLIVSLACFRPSTVFLSPPLNFSARAVLIGQFNQLCGGAHYLPIKRPDPCRLPLEKGRETVFFFPPTGGECDLIFPLE